MTARYFNITPIIGTGSFDKMSGFNIAVFSHGFAVGAFKLAIWTYNPEMEERLGSSCYKLASLLGGDKLIGSRAMMIIRGSQAVQMCRQKGLL